MWRHGERQALLLWALVCVPGLSLGEAPLDSLAACTELTADKERLACFDREMAEIRRNSAPKPQAVPPTAEQAFGLSSRQVLALEAKPGQVPAPTELHAHVVGVSRSAKDRQIFVLDNTQTWQQIELEPDFPVRIGQEITISKGALGAFWLAIDSHRATRVKRIQSLKSG
jgi:hypothetical protein